MAHDKLRLAIHNLVLPLCVAMAWRLAVPLQGRVWPLGLDALFSTDLPAILAIFWLARCLAPSPDLQRFDRWLLPAYGAAAALPFLALKMNTRVDAATALYVGLAAAGAVLGFIAAGRALRSELAPGWRSSAALFCCFAGVYGAVGRYTCHVAAPTGDEPHYLMVAHSLWQDGDLDLADDFAAQEHRAFYPAPFGPRPWDIQTEDGRILSWGGAGFPALLAIPYGLGGRSGAVLFVNLVTALAMLRCYRLGRKLGGSHEQNLAACLAMGLGLPVVAYSSLLYPETTAGLLVVLALSAQRPMAILGLLLALALLRAKYLALALPVALVLTAQARGRNTRLAAGAFGLLLGAYVIADLWLLNGEYSGRIAGFMATAPREVLLQGRVGRLFGLWLDQEGGVLLYNPLLAAGLIALAPLARRGGAGLAAAVAAVAYSLAAGAAYEGWYGEWWVPGRFLVPVAFLLAIALGAAPWRVTSRWTPLLIFGAIQAGTLALALILSPRLAYNYADGTASVLGALEEQLRVPVCRYFPSFIRPGEPSQWASLTLIAGVGGILALARGAWRRPVLGGIAVFVLLWSLPMAGSLMLSTRVVEVEDTLVWSRKALPWPSGRPYHQRLALGDLRMGLRLPPGSSLAADILAPPGPVGFLITASAQGGDGTLEVWLNGIFRSSLLLPEGHWGPFGSYTMKSAGWKPLELKNTGDRDILVDRIEVIRP